MRHSEVPVQGLTAAELRKHVGSYWATVQQVEIDYLQYIILSGLSVGQQTVSAKHPNQASLLYAKGGTALQKAGFTNRFSFDIDFSLGKRDIGQLSSIASVAQEELLRYGFESTVTFREYRKHEVKHDTIGVKFRINGPLYHGSSRPSQRSQRVIVLDMGYRDKVLLDPIFPLITPELGYKIQPYSLQLMNPTEILAEKIRAILTRGNIRSTVSDSFDAWVLIGKGVALDMEVVKIKLATFGKRFDMNEFRKRIDAQGAVWNTVFEDGSRKETGTYFRLPDIPNFNEVATMLLDLVASKRP
ncbi:MAG: nucleotidyl transferase AbiEii/AbiGii toxin family protein [Candidatus Micrarchaeaceae archaeon]